MLYVFEPSFVRRPWSEYLFDVVCFFHLQDRMPISDERFATADQILFELLLFFEILVFVHGPKEFGVQLDPPAPFLFV